MSKKNRLLTADEFAAGLLKDWKAAVKKAKLSKAQERKLFNAWAQGMMWGPAK